MRNVSFAKKLLLTNMAFAVPILVLAFQMYKAQTTNIDFAVQEQRGNRYQRPLEKLLEHITKHKLVALRGLADGSQLQSEMTQIETDVDASFASLVALHQELGPTLLFSPEELAKRKRDKIDPEHIKELWDELKRLNVSQGYEESKIKHNVIISGVRTMIAHMGDTSNLILDPDLDSYYLMDVTLLALPQMQDRVQDIVTTVEPMLRRGTLSAEDRVKLAVYAALLQESDVARIIASTATAVNEDAGFYGRSETLEKTTTPHVEKLKSETSHLIKMLVDLSTQQVMSIGPEQFASQAKQVSAASFQLWWAGIDELDLLLRSRLSVLTWERQRSLIFASVALLISSLFSYFVGRNLVSNLKISVEQMRSSAEDAMNASSNLVDMASSASDATFQQSSSIREAVATTRKIGVLVERGLESVNRSTDLTKSSQTIANQGQTAVKEIVQAIDAIDSSNKHVMEAITNSNKRISEIVKVINGISNKTQVINDIVFQTRLLSFNASVEAARAGEAGKGFSVVAEEVGNLAQLSGRASGEISKMLEESVARVQAIVSETSVEIGTLIRNGNDKVSAGILIAQRCGNVLEEVVQNTELVTRLITEIANAQNEQAKGVEGISHAMTELEGGTVASARTADDTAALAQQLADQSEKLRAIVSAVETQVLGQVSAAPLVEHNGPNTNAPLSLTVGGHSGRQKNSRNIAS